MKKTLLLLFKRIIISFVLILTGQSAFAQASFTVKLKLIDAKTSEPVSYATASLTVKGESTAAKYVMTDAEGVASLPKIKKGTYVLKAELMGYNTHQQEITVEKNMDLGEIKLSEDVKVLDAASVSAVGNPIVVKKDTVEYAASSFKTSDNDMLEELLKKLPGVEVAADGSIT
ncbi:MAG: carboxypeptidase-like regulatory domain-containing protein, partial [Bacteroidales bacterium]|nr:carboxypeptidase-like regulatory domain-containing protein [Bacteroidales bacterium]